MYRIMIIDDEPLILAGITSLISWEEYDCSIVSKANNGVQALKQIDQLKPDIIITDIKMPVMTGLDLIEECKQLSYEPVFIVLTNLEEFELAKRALTLGASEYLVKLKLTKETLTTALTHAIKVFEEKVKLKTNRFIDDFFETSNEDMIKSFFKQLLLGSIKESESSQKLAEHLHLTERFQSPILVMINLNYTGAHFSQDFTKSDQKQLLNYASNIISEMIPRFFSQYSIIEWDQGSLLCLLNTFGMEELQSTLKTFGIKVATMLKTYFEVAAAIGISEPIKQLFLLPDFLYQAITAVNYYYFDSSSPVIFYSDQCNQISHKSNFDISFMKKDLYMAFIQNDCDKLTLIFTQIIELFTSYEPGKQQAINACINIYYYIISFFEDKDSKDELFPPTINVISQLNHLGSLKDITGWLNIFCSNLCRILESRKNNKTDTIIALIKRYIQTHYKEKLTLHIVSQELNISTGYLSATFKKNTGDNFSDYIAKVKIDNAKELIAQHDFLMYEIADQLGFENPYYFSKVFKKVTGLTPSEYEMTTFL